MQSDIEKIVSLYAKPLWSNKDIMIFTGCSVNKASEIRKEAINEANGLPVIYPKKVKRDAVLKVLGLDFKNEMSKIKLLKEIKK